MLNVQVNVLYNMGVAMVTFICIVLKGVIRHFWIVNFRINIKNAFNYQPLKLLDNLTWNQKYWSKCPHNIEDTETNKLPIPDCCTKSRCARSARNIGTLSAR